MHATHQLIEQPRRFEDIPFGYEANFVDTLRDAVAHAAANGLDAPLVQLLEGAWQWLQRSGLLEARCIERRIARDVATQQALKATTLKSLTAPGRRSCALPGCSAKEAHPAHFKSCASCRTVVYCCREHQVEGWPGHKKACKAARNAAAAAEEDGAGPSGA